MDGIFFLMGYGAATIGRLTGHIEDASKHAFANGDGDRSAECTHFHAASETFCGAHGDRANPVFTEVLLNLESEVLLFAADFEVDLESIVNFGQSAVRWVELDIDNGADDLNYSSFMIHVWLVSVKRVLCLASGLPNGNCILKIKKAGLWVTRGFFEWRQETRLLRRRPRRDDHRLVR